MDICVYTRDERLRHRLSLLSDSYALTDARHAALAVWDADTCPPPVTALPVLCITRSEERAAGVAHFLLRPFSAEALEKKLAAMACESLFPSLSPTEKKLLFLLTEAGEAGVDTESLLRALWGEGGNEGLLKVHICYLRKKIEHDGKKRIFSLRGKGYKYRADPFDR